MTATDPLLAEAAAMDTSAAAFQASTLDALRSFFAGAVDRCLKGTVVHFEASLGKPDEAIRRVARERGAGLVVMSSHGLSGFRKMFFGSTTERVLRETRVPVLIAPGDDRGPSSIVEVARNLRRILVPVLLPPAHATQLSIAREISRDAGAAMVLLHVVEPLRGVIPQTDRYLATVERERRLRAQHALDHLIDSSSVSRDEALIAHGETAEEIAKVARDRAAGLIVMGLYASPLQGPRIGSVTYRVLCAASCPVLALPVGNFPQRAKKATRGAQAQSARSANSLSKSVENASGTARALKRADTRFLRNARLEKE